MTDQPPDELACPAIPILAAIPLAELLQADNQRVVDAAQRIRDAENSDVNYAAFANTP